MSDPTERPADERTAEVVVAFSHELRSPLASLRGFTQMLLDRWDRIPDDDRRDLLVQIDHDARRVGRLVDELLDVSRIDTGRYRMWRSPVDLPELAAGVVRHVHAAHAELHCPVTADADVPLVLADADKVEQVLVNLLENGVKYATPGRMHIHVATAGAAVQVLVADEGPGLAPADRERIFDRAASAAAAAAGRPSGLGLGLWIARTIAEAHDGTLDAVGNAQGGTTFRLTLPFPPPTD